MAYRLSAGDAPVSRQLHQVFLDQMDSAIDHLSKATPADRETRIHEARKDIKKVRALLRLVAHQLGKAVFRAENQRIRDIGRKLSPLRDAHAIIESVQTLPEGAMTARSRGAFLKRLEAQKARVYRSLAIEQVLASAAEDLKAARPHIDALALAGEGYNAIEPGLLSIYRQGRKALRRARRTLCPEHLHDLRKRVKDHSYQVRLLNGFPVEILKGRQETLRALETALGEAHNLHVLRESLGARRTAQKVLAALAAREDELSAEALTLASSLYNLKTGEIQKCLSPLGDLMALQLRKDSAKKSSRRELPAAASTREPAAINA